MSKIEPYRDFKASKDYRLKTSVDFYRPLEMFNGNQKPDFYLDWVSGEAGVPSGIGYACLGFQISTSTAHWKLHQMI